MSSTPNLELPFTKIERKSRKNRPRKIVRPEIDDNELPLNEEQKLSVLRHIQEAKIDISESDLYHSALASLKEGIEILENTTVKQIICLGLGKVSRYLRSKYQLAFLLCLRDKFKIEIKVSDPLFSACDRYVLNQLNITVLDENLEGKYKVLEGSIFFLPHCPHQLTNNLIWRNWGLNLHNCIVISNSLNGIIENNSSKNLAICAEYIVKINPHTVELAIANTFKIYDIFNDTAIHVFPRSKLKLLPGDFWSSNPEPKYPKEFCELITNDS